MLLLHISISFCYKFKKTETQLLNLHIVVIHTTKVNGLKIQTSHNLAKYTQSACTHRDRMCITCKVHVKPCMCVVKMCNNLPLKHARTL